MLATIKDLNEVHGSDSQKCEFDGLNSRFENSRDHHKNAIVLLNSNKGDNG